MLSRYQPIADAIATLFSPYAEVAIHDLASQKLVYIANNYSQRELGEDSNLSDLRFDQHSQVIGPYQKRNWDGRQLRSISTVLRDDNRQPIGLLCINLDITVFESAKAALELFLSGQQLQPQPEVLFQDDWQERINTYIHQWLQQQQLTLAALNNASRRMLIETLYQQGAFNGKNAAGYVAKILGIARATVYNHLKNIKTS
ncbi:helix-turn-helix transcriptional regulator [Yersinia intermedia]|uniref:helix-turn-helix transcriptional regulator n=1 Tax=Yersinia intermedia TaxID=631 RepID=UPI0005E4B597|nr:PAS domain-containing protein [Yersinia intermedia]MCB5323222.1 PAS domain-containing protein [Yersinia intermedia]UNK23498.1 PAS domain-containing protein [Yersinia intermedia]CNB92596.1 yheo-like PAS domain [Yersinia intermedia]CNC38281.1 yheo-like PAS domain [Yersinia intermedia]CNG63132.1 yheo-like PAS domain [Yersinia intermedia]